MTRIRISAQEAVAIVCLVTLAAGCALVYLPLGLIVPSALVLIYLVLPDQGESA